MRNALFTALFACGAVLLPARQADACGGFFCSQSPVDQNAERILFVVDEEKSTTDMIVQITYQGEDDAFAWVLPLGAVPQNLDVFPSMALSSLDVQTGPTFQPPPACEGWVFTAGGPTRGGGADAGAAAPPMDSGVIVHVRETIGDYDVAVIESESADASFQWLLDNHYRLSSVMKPYIELYTAQQMKFLALKLTADATTDDIKPFKMTLPGTTPTIPLRLTAIAAEPEMGVVAWVLGQRRYEPANAEEFTIAKEDLRWQPNSWPIRTNWTQLVARGVDQRGGRAWVVEQAGSTESLLTTVQSSGVSGEEQQEAQQALVDVLTGRPYLTRLYTRVAAEEMGYDPTFRRSDKPDVPRTRELPYIEEICDIDSSTPPPTYPCDFAACGQLGLCREVAPSDGGVSVQARAACACAPGTSARTTFDPQGQPTVSCQDQRMSFMNPGERDEAGAVFSDPCVGFSCGEHGSCVAMNLTPTCVCDEGYVAIGSIAADGSRATECVMPAKAVPKSFYNRRPPALAEGMLAGRAVTLPAPTGVPDTEMPEQYGDPMPNPGNTADDPQDGNTSAKSSDGGCSAGARASAGGSAMLGVLLALGALLRRRRQS